MISVVLIDLGSHRTSTLSAALADAGYRVSHVLAGDADVASEISAINPDAVLIAASSASRDSLEHLAFLSDDFPKPLFMILSQDDRKLQAAAADVGLSAYVVEGLSPALVRTTSTAWPSPRAVKPMARRRAPAGTPRAMSWTRLFIA